MEKAFAPRWNLWWGLNWPWCEMWPLFPSCLVIETQSLYSHDFRAIPSAAFRSHTCAWGCFPEADLCHSLRGQLRIPYASLVQLRVQCADTWLGKKVSVTVLLYALVILTYLYIFILTHIISYDIFNSQYHSMSTLNVPWSVGSMCEGPEGAPNKAWSCTGSQRMISAGSEYLHPHAARTWKSQEGSTSLTVQNSAAPH